MSNFVSYWRTAGLSYIQYLNKCTAASHAVLKDSFKTKYAIRDQYHFVTQMWTPELVKAGKVPPKVTISNVVDASAQ